MGKLSPTFEKADTSAAYPYGAMNFIPANGNSVPNCQQLYEVARNLSQDGGRSDFSLSLINAFRIHLVSARHISLDSTLK
jgi:hypothetical protein